MGEPKVTIHPTGDAQVQPASPATPSERLIEQALKPEVLEADDGMTISVRQPDVLAPYDLIEALGAELAGNHTYMQMVNPLVYVGAINGEPVFQPANKGEVRAMIKRLGHSGMGALNAWYVGKVLGPTADAMERAEQDARRQAQVKN